MTTQVDLNLFSETKNYLNLVYNDKRVFNDPLEFFDTNKFNSLKLVTFVSSPSFLFKNIKNFEKVVAVIGEEETARIFYTLNNVDKQEEYMKAAEQEDIELVKKIVNDDIELRYLGMNKRIHSKIYILNSPDESFYRVMFGSANFTATAFGNNKQYEELVIYDSDYNLDICKIYNERFSEIYENSYSYFSDTIKNKAKNDIIQAQNIFLVTDDDRVDAFLEKIDKENIYNTSADNIMTVISQKKDVLEKDIALIEKEEEIVNILTFKSKGQSFFKPQVKLSNVREKIKEIVAVPNKKPKNVVNMRKQLIFDGQVMLYEKESDDDKFVMRFPIKTTQDGLQKRLIQITNFVDSYYKFAANPDKDIMKNVFESILFAFTSPLIHVIRKTIKDEKEMEKVAEVPIILILGGHSGAGKTKLLRFINRLIGNEYDIYDYAKDIDSRNKTLLRYLIESSKNNVFPILADEISASFYKGKGEETIKSLTNNIVHPHPCLIGTSNIEFGAEHQVIRRIYYLNFTSPIDTETRKNEIEEYFDEKVGNPDDVLFRHFLFEFIERMHNGETFYTLEDPLYLSRIVFKDMFKSVELPVPDFISDRPRGDYYKTGSIRWNALYSTQPNYFKRMKDSGENYLVIDLDSIYDVKESKSLQNCIPPSVVKSKGNPLILFEDRFFEFIGRNAKWSKIKRFFGAR